jgi:hypothetical protein
MRTAVLCGIALALNSVLFINLCNLVYQCGCKSLWDGADEHCNIHAKHGRHCPFCSHGNTGYGLFFSAILFPQFGIAYISRRRSAALQLSAILVSFPVCFAIVALVVGLMDGYWKS